MGGGYAARSSVMVARILMDFLVVVNKNAKLQ